MFLNSLAVAAVLWFILIFALAFRANLKVGWRKHNLSANTFAIGVVGLLWLVFGGA